MHYHTYLWDLVDHKSGDLFSHRHEAHGNVCKRDSMLNAPYTDWMEWQAGYVCGAVLMPISALTSTVRDHLDREGQNAPLACNTPEAARLIDAVVRQFQVSREAARVRLLKLKFLSDAGSGHGIIDL